MKFKFLIPTLVFFVFSSFNIRCAAQKTCKCYTSDTCEPRELAPGEKPFYDKETGICFCTPKDKERFGSRGCKHHAVPTIHQMNCCPGRR